MALSESERLWEKVSRFPVQQLKTILLLMITVWIAAFSIQAVRAQDPVPEKPLYTQGMVVVGVFSETLPNEEALPQFLWDRFSKSPELIAVYDLNTLDWDQQYLEYAAELVRKAKEAKLDATNLERLLAHEAQTLGSRAHVPVAAYSTKIAGRPAWIILSHWEYSDRGKMPKVTKTKGMPKIEFPCHNLGHIEMGAYDSETLKCLGFNTCM
jgi:hypothetical protein